jgi:hypothetical protein
LQRKILHEAQIADGLRADSGSFEKLLARSDTLAATYFWEYELNWSLRFLTAFFYRPSMESPPMKRLQGAHDALRKLPREWLSTLQGISQSPFYIFHRAFVASGGGNLDTGQCHLSKKNMSCENITT